MRHSPFPSIAGRTGVSLRVLRQFGSLLLPLLAVVLTALHLHAQLPTAYTPKELLATDPRVFADWLETHRPRSVSASQKARILEVLPAEGEITNLDDAGRQKLAAVKQLLQATDRESGYEVKVIDVSYARIAVFARSVILISKSAFMLLDTEELHALAAHEIGHEYFTIDYESAFRTRNHRRLKDLELLCDAIATVTVHRLGTNPARLLSAIDKIARHNQKLFPTSIDDTNYPTIAERRSFVRRVTAWLQAAGLADDAQGTPRTPATDSRRASRGWRAPRNCYRRPVIGRTAARTAGLPLTAHATQQER